MKMKMKILEIQIVKTKSEKVKARADVHFDGFLLKGFKVIQDPITLKEYATPPSYLSHQGWRALFKTDLPEDWEEIQRRIIEEYNLNQIKETADEAYEKEEN
jgi:hypothetical protein